MPDSVTETVIPTSDDLRYTTAMHRRKELAIELHLAFEKFSQLEAEMQFMHRKNVEDTHRALEEVVRLVDKYKRNLGW